MVGPIAPLIDAEAQGRWASSRLGGVGALGVGCLASGNRIQDERALPGWIADDALKCLCRAARYRLSGQQHGHGAVRPLQPQRELGVLRRAEAEGDRLADVKDGAGAAPAVGSEVHREWAHDCLGGVGAFFMRRLRPRDRIQDENTLPRRVADDALKRLRHAALDRLIGQQHGRGAVRPQQPQRDLRTHRGAEVKSDWLADVEERGPPTPPVGLEGHHERLRHRPRRVGAFRVRR